MRVQFAPFTLDTETRQLLRGDAPVHLSPKAFQLLSELVRRRPAVMSKADLVDLLWPGTFVVDANLSVVVADVRRALGDDPQMPRFIRTVHRHGYAFCGNAVDAERTPTSKAAARAGLVLAGRVLFLSEGENVIGRDPACDVWLDLPGVSRRHARILISASEAVLEDLRSKNGTFVGDLAVRGQYRLRDEEVIQMGSAEVVFRLWSPSTAAETERIARRSAPRATSGR